MKIGASTLSGFKGKLEKSLEFIENNGIEYAEILHQYPNETINTEITDSFNLKYTIHSPIININIASLSTAIRKASIEEIKKSIDTANEIGAELKNLLILQMKSVLKLLLSIQDQFLF